MPRLAPEAGRHISGECDTTTNGMTTHTTLRLPEPRSSGNREKWPEESRANTNNERGAVNLLREPVDHGSRTDFKGLKSQEVGCDACGDA
jgi:hypothetical protein